MPPEQRFTQDFPPTDGIAAVVVTFVAACRRQQSGERASVCTPKRNLDAIPDILQQIVATKKRVIAAKARVPESRLKARCAAMVRKQVISPRNFSPPSQGARWPVTSNRRKSKSPHTRPEA